MTTAGPVQSRTLRRHGPH